MVEGDNGNADLDQRIDHNDDDEQKFNTNQPFQPGAHPLPVMAVKQLKCK